MAALRDGAPARALAAGSALGSRPVAPPAHGLARFPILRATLRYGSAVAAATGVLATLCVAALAWSWLGVVGFVPALALGGFVAVTILAFTELVRLITELLIPN